jgi:hypothetical protein
MSEASEGQPIQYKSSEEIIESHQVELDNYAETIKIGSPGLLALNDMHNTFRQRLELMELHGHYARIKRRVPDSQDSAEGREATLEETKRKLIVAEVAERQIEREIGEHTVSIPGYYEASDKLGRISARISNPHDEPVRLDAGGDLQRVYGAFRKARKSVLERESKPKSQKTDNP